ncbi:MAG: GFA family protein [Parvularculaceae bacterium]
MKKVSLPLNGGCHCGALRFEISAAPLTVYCCHCTNCQKITTSAFAISMIIPEAAFVFTKGEAKRIEWAADSGAERYGWFCGECGGRIAHGQTPSNGFLSLRAGTLDNSRWLKPVGHIWTKSAQSWMKFAEDDLICETQPTDYGPYAARFRAFGLFDA